MAIHFAFCVLTENFLLPKMQKMCIIAISFALRVILVDYARPQN